MIRLSILLTSAVLAASGCATPEAPTAPPHPPATACPDASIEERDLVLDRLHFSVNVVGETSNSVYREFDWPTTRGRVQWNLEASWPATSTSPSELRLFAESGGGASHLADVVGPSPLTGRFSLAQWPEDELRIHIGPPPNSVVLEDTAVHLRVSRAYVCG